MHEHPDLYAVRILSELEVRNFESQLGMRFPPMERIGLEGLDCQGSAQSSGGEIY